MIHSGSRNLGKQVAEHYNNVAKLINESMNTGIPESHDLACLPLDCEEGKAYLREMQYCVDYALANRRLMMSKVIDIFYNIIPYQEIFIGSNFKTYKQIYYLAYFPYDKNLDYNNINYDKVEIGDAKWCNIDECKLLIRNYNLEKLKIITKIDNILTEYKI